MTVLQFLTVLLIALLAFYAGYRTSKEELEKVKAQIKKIKPQSSGAVIKPKSAEEIRKEKTKKFYDSL